MQDPEDGATPPVWRSSYGTSEPPEHGADDRAKDSSRRKPSQALIACGAATVGALVAIIALTGPTILHGKPIAGVPTANASDLAAVKAERNTTPVPPPAAPATQAAPAADQPSPPQLPPPPPQLPQAPPRHMSTWTYEVRWGGPAGMPLPSIAVIEHAGAQTRTIYAGDGGDPGSGTGWTGDLVGADPVISGLITWASCKLYINGVVAKSDFATAGDGHDVSCLARLD